MGVGLRLDCHSFDKFTEGPKQPLVPPCHPDADVGFIVMEQAEYPAMSGGNTISVATVLLETGILPMKEPATELTLELPAGLIGIKADCVNGKVVNVTFENVRLLPPTQMSRLMLRGWER